MPGYYEHEDVEHDEAAENADVSPMLKPTSLPGPSASRAKSHPPQPVATPSMPPSTQKKPSSAHQKPHSTSAALSTTQDDDDVAAEEHTCPICARTLATDNAGLNAHVDFCLSRSAIREAQQTTGGASSGLKPLTFGAVGAKRKRKKG